MSRTEPISPITKMALGMWQANVQRQLREIELAARSSEQRGLEWRFNPELACWETEQEAP